MIIHISSSHIYVFSKCRKGLQEYELDIELRLADRFYPSSKLCSDCGFKYKDLKLSERFWTCSNCGSEHDRDVNEAINLRQCKQYTVLTAV